MSPRRKQHAETPIMPTAIDLFSGVGGMSLGFSMAGFRIVGAVEIDPRNCTTYRSNFPSTPCFDRDITTLTGGELLAGTSPTVVRPDVVFGGPPCQGFSLIGRRNENDERNGLLSQFARLVVETSPRYFVLENVPGLLLGASLKSLARFARTMKDAGYTIVEPVEILNASDFGVPQRRKRAFILGYRNGERPPRYPIPLPCNNHIACKKPPTVFDAIADLQLLDLEPELHVSDRYLGELGPASEYVHFINGIKGTVNLRTGLGGCLLTRHSDDTRDRFDSTPPGQLEPISRFHRLSFQGLAPTLRAGTGPDRGSHTAARPIHPRSPRCITTREAARLHSYPDWFEFHPTKWHGFRQVGNSVPPLLAAALASKLLQVL